MDFKRNSLFFDHKRTKRWTYVTYVSYAFIAAAVLVFIITSWLPLALPFACVGVAILLTALSMMTSEKQIKEQIALLQNGAKETALAHFGYPDQNPDCFFEFEGYDLIDPSVTLRKLRNGRVFSSSYVITYLMIENKTLRIWEKKSSITEDREEILTRDIPLTDISGAQLVNETTTRLCNDGLEKSVPVIAVQVLDSDKNIVCTANCKSYDYDMERFVEILAHNIKRANES